MNKIEFDEKKILYPFNTSGKESIIYLYNDKDTLLKYFRNAHIEYEIKKYYLKLSDYTNYTLNSGFVIADEDLKNKEKKIKLISNLRELKDEIEILDLVYNDGNFKGYTMKKENMIPIDIFSSKKKKIRWLKLIKEKILLLNSNNIYIGDFNLKNFLTSKSCTEIKLCDLDNLRINELDFDTKHGFVQIFEKKCSKKEYIDSYCFNLFTITFMQRTINHISYVNNLPYILNTKENNEIFESMMHLDNSYEYKFLIDNLK